MAFKIFKKWLEDKNKKENLFFYTLDKVPQKNIFIKNYNVNY